MPIFTCNTCKDTGKVGWFFDRKPCPDCMHHIPKASKSTVNRDLPKVSSGTKMPAVKPPKDPPKGQGGTTEIGNPPNKRPEQHRFNMPDIGHFGSAGSSGSCGYFGTSGSCDYPHGNLERYNFEMSIIKEKYDTPDVDVRFVTDHSCSFSRKLVIKYNNRKDMPKEISIDIPDTRFDMAAHSIGEFKELMSWIEDKIQPIVLNKDHVIYIMKDICQLYSYTLNNAVLSPETHTRPY